MERSHSITRPPSQQMESRSPRSRVVAALMCFFFGYFGVHRFYAGKFWTGLLMLVTGGGFGIWWLVDLVIILLGRFKDAENRVIGPPRVDDQRARRRQLDRDHSGEADDQPPRDRAMSDESEDVRLEDLAEDEDVSLEDEDLVDDPLEEKFAELEQEMDDRSSSR